MKFILYYCIYYTEPKKGCKFSFFISNASAFGGRNALNIKPKNFHCAQSQRTHLTKRTLNMSAEAFCVFKRSKVSIQAKRAHRPDRKLPQKHRDCLDGWSSNMTLLSLCLSHASQSHPPTSFSFTDTLLLLSQFQPQSD